MKRKRNYILITAILCTIGMLLVDGLLKPPYLVKSLIKIALFGGCVLSWALLHKERSFFFRMRKRSLVRIALLSVGVYLLIVAGYFLTRSFIDYSGIPAALSASVGVTKENCL